MSGHKLQLSNVILHGNPDSTFDTTPIATPEFSKITTLAAKDLNGDGIPDMVGAGNEGTIIYLGKPGLQFALPIAYSSSPGYYNFGLNDPLIYDVNGDGRADLIAPNNSYPTGDVWVMLSNGDGSFSAQSIGSFNSSLSVAAGNMNGDKKFDLIVSIARSAQIFLVKGDGTFNQAVSAPAVPSTGDAAFNPGQAVFGDFDGDGKTDFVVTATTVWVLTI